MQESEFPNEIESIHLDIDDDLLNSSDKYINTWGLWKRHGRIEHHFPGQMPIDLSFGFKDGSELKVFFESGEWGSKFTNSDGEFQLSPDQFGQFFNTEYYKKFENALGDIWDLSDDEYYDLYD